MNRPFRAAVIGCGRIGVTMESDPFRIKPATHAGAFSQSKLTELAALVDNNSDQLKKAKALFPGVPVYANAEDMLQACKPDIVSIAVEPAEHRPLVELCAGHRVPAILCEKPIALSPTDSEAMIKICRQNKSLLFVNHSRRFDPELRKTSEEIRNGALGLLHQGSAYYTAGLLNTGTHLVDLLRFLIGKEVEWVSAFHERRFTAPPGDFNVNGWLMFEGNLPVCVQALEVKDYAIFEVRLWGSQKTLVVDRFGFSTEWFPVIDSPLFQGYKELDWHGSGRKGDSRSFMQAVVEHMIDCLEGRAKPVSSGEEALQTLLVLNTLQESAERQGQKVRVPKKALIHE